MEILNYRQMSAAQFFQLRTTELRRFYRGRYGRPWRFVSAKQMGRRDAPRFLVCPSVPVTFKQLDIAEKFAEKQGFRPGRWLNRSEYGAPEASGVPQTSPSMANEKS
jgi:hypothetical protein